MHRVARLAGLCLVPACDRRRGVGARRAAAATGRPPAATRSARRGSGPTRSISKESLQKPGFQLLWKSKLDNQPKQLVSLTQPLLLQNIISYKGFKALAFVGGSADNVYSIDYDLNKLFWKAHLSSGVTTAGTAACPAALTTITAVSAAGRRRGGRGRGAPACTRPRRHARAGARSAGAPPREPASRVRLLEVRAAARRAPCRLARERRRRRPRPGRRWWWTRRRTRGLRRCNNNVYRDFERRHGPRPERADRRGS